MAITMGIDASTTSSGYAIFNGRELIAYGCIKPQGDEWRERVLALGEPLNEIIQKYHPTKIIMEDVPLSTGGGVRTGVILGFLQGFIFGLVSSYGIEIVFVSPSQWRSKVGVFTGDREGTKRQALKRASIEKANELFGINLKWVSPSSSKNEDDTSDAILVAYSQLIAKPKPTKRRFTSKKKT